MFSKIGFKNLVLFISLTSVFSLVYAQETEINAETENSPKINMAVSDFEGRNISAMDATAVTDFVRTGFVNTGKYNVVDRGNMESILAEQKFQLSGCTSEECAVKLGKMLNVRLVVVGSVIKLGQIFYINANMVNVETGQIQSSKKVKAETIEGLAVKADELAALIAGTAVETVKKEEPKPEETAPTKKEEKKDEKSTIDFDLGPKAGIFLPLDEGLTKDHSLGLLLGVDATLWLKRLGIQYSYDKYTNSKSKTIGGTSVTSDLSLISGWYSLLFRGRGSEKSFIGAGIGSVKVEQTTGETKTDGSFGGTQFIIGFEGNHAGIVFKYSTVSVDEDDWAYKGLGGISAVFSLFI